LIREYFGMSADHGSQCCVFFSTPLLPLP
jgi:hypothetical protein